MPRPLSAGTKAVIKVLKVNEKPMSRIGIHAELPDHLAPEDVTRVSKWLYRLNNKGLVEHLDGGLWQITQLGEQTNV